MKRVPCLAVILLALYGQLSAQEKCGSQILLNQERAAHSPTVLIEDSLNHLGSLFQEEAGERGTTYFIPIVVHVVHDYGAEYISDAQIINAINQLNLDFSSSNSDTSSIINVFKPLIGNAQIEFRPARFDPDGNCTNGIDRIADESTYNGYSKPNPWPQYRYLNFWVVNNIIGGNSGYATFPFSSNPLSQHGVVVQYNSFNTTSRTPTHECGHFFNLYHIWDTGNACGATCGGNDYVNDTPETIGYTGCPSPASVEVCNPGIKENYQNFMDYTNCGAMFTHDQVTRMRNALSSPLGARQSLRTDTTANFTGIMLPMVTCPPKIDFKPGYFSSVCVGDSVHFEQLTYGSAATGFSWSFPGGTPATSSLPNVWVTYNTPGMYDVILTASNTAGSATLQKTATVQVLAGTAMQTLPFAEGFEDSISFQNNWTVFSKSNNWWQRLSVASYGGNYSCGINNNTSNNNEVDWLISPTIDLTSATDPMLYFARAFTIKNGSNDVLKIFYSTNCGNDWLGPIYTKSGAALATVPPDTMGFIPDTLTDWDLDTIALAPIAGESNVRFGFKFESDKGNNIFIDNINIQSLTSSLAEHENPVSGLQVYPNPASELTHVSFRVQKKNKYELWVTDISGRVVTTTDLGYLETGDFITDVNTQLFPAGIYQVILKTNGQQMVEKLMVVR
jgi:PKD repeat protein